MTNDINHAAARAKAKKRMIKRKRKIGLQAIKLAQKKELRERIKAKSAVSLFEIQEYAAQHTPEYNDKFYKGLWACTTVAEVIALLRKWWNTFIKKVQRSIKRRKLSAETRATLDALLMATGATSTTTLLNRRICEEAFRMLHASLVAKVTADPELEIAFVTVICGSGATSHTRTVIELFNSQAAVQRTLRAMSPDFFGITELALFNSHGHPDGGQLAQRHEHGLVIGKGVVQRARLIARKHEKHFRPNSTGAAVIDVKKVATDEVNLARIAAYMFKPPYKCLTWNPGKDGKKGHMSGSEKGDRFIRYLRLAQFRSMMTIEQVTFGGGLGNTIRSEMIKFLRALASKEVAASGAALHPDAIASFWVGLTQEMKAKNWNLPVIKTRK